MTEASPILLRNGLLVDGTSPDPRGPFDILIEGPVISELSDTPIRSAGATSFDLKGRTIMPGLIDAHVHVMVSELDIGRLGRMPPTLAAARAASIMKGMLDRGFTTVRDTAGADFGLRESVATGLFPGPRLFVCGRAISQTGGHVDYRLRTDQGKASCGCCSGLELTARVADGVPEMLHAVREELRFGADHIKLTVSGGVASPSDPLESLQFTVEEIKAAVDAATDWGSYVCAHAYSAAAIRRALECGVRSIEHANMIDLPTAKLAADKGAFIVPTLVTYQSMDRYGRDLGMPEISRAKNARVLEAGLQSLEICQEAGVDIGFGTDLLGELHPHQSREFLIRSDVMAPADIIRSATSVNARLIRQEGKLGTIMSGATADILVVDGNPLADLGLLQDQGRHLAAIMKDGRFHKNQLAAA